MSLYRCGGGDRIKLRTAYVSSSSTVQPTSLTDFVGRLSSNELLIYPSNTDKAYIIHGGTGGGTRFTCIIDLVNRTFKYYNDFTQTETTVDFASNVIKYGDLIQIVTANGSNIKFDNTPQRVVAIY